MIRATIFALSLLVGMTEARCEEQLRIKIIDYGIYLAKFKDRPPGPNEGMKPALSAKICHVATTKTVSTRENVQFGFRFQMEGPQRGTSVDFWQAIRRPDLTQPAGAPAVYVVNRSPQTHRVGGTRYFGWTNRHSRPGTWTFQVGTGDRTLADMVFTLLDDIGAKEEVDQDSTCFQVSDAERRVRSGVT